MTARSASSLGRSGWDGGTMHFTVDADPGAIGLRAMLPLTARDGTLTSLSRGGAAVPYVTRTIKGVTYAVFGAASGSYAAVYG